MWHHGSNRWGRRGWLRPWVIGILRSSPKNGAEICDQVEQMSLGWRPSPGSIYPLLEELSTEGLIRRREDGRYEVTAQGREGFTGPWEFLSQRSATVEGIVQEMQANVSYLEDMATSHSERLSPYWATIRQLAERLKRIDRT